MFRSQGKFSKQVLVTGKYQEQKSLFLAGTPMMMIAMNMLMMMMAMMLKVMMNIMVLMMTLMMTLMLTMTMMMTMMKYIFFSNNAGRKNVPSQAVLTCLFVIISLVVVIFIF